MRRSQRIDMTNEEIYTSQSVSQRRYTVYPTPVSFLTRRYISPRMTRTVNDRPDLLEHALIPVAHEDDALATARALEPYGPDRVTALHVVEKGEGVPDKTPVEQSKEVAAASFSAVEEVFPEAGAEIAYGRDVVETIFETADDVDATAIAYRPRESNRILRALTGDLSLRLVTESPIPVIGLPDPHAEDAEDAGDGSDDGDDTDG